MGTPELLTDIRERMVKLETLQETNAQAISNMAGSVNRLVDRLEQSDDIAREADQRSKSAHHRLDKIDKIIYWASTTVFGAIIVAVMAFIFRGGISG